MRTVKCECCGEAFEAPTRATKLCDKCRRCIKAPGVHTKVQKQKANKEREKEPDKTRCRTCRFASRYSDSPNDILCDYILIMGHSRGCDPGKDCTKYEKRKEKRVCRPY